MTHDHAAHPRTDRRRVNLPLWHPRRLRGRRRAQRRAEDDRGPHLVDRIHGAAFAASGLLLVLTLVDGLLTVALLDRGFEEANPAMRFLLEQGTWAFFIGKYALTAVFLPVALVMNRYRLFGTLLRVGHLIPVVGLLYVLLIAYQVSLFSYPG